MEGKMINMFKIRENEYINLDRLIEIDVVGREETGEYNVEFWFDDSVVLHDGSLLELVDADRLEILLKEKPDITLLGKLLNLASICWRKICLNTT